MHTFGNKFRRRFFCLHKRPLSHAPYSTFIIRLEFCDRYKFFVEGYYHSLLFSKQTSADGSIQMNFKLRCHRSMRKRDLPHKIEIHLQHSSTKQTVTVKHGHCSCIAGKQGSCNHCFAPMCLISN